MSRITLTSRLPAVSDEIRRQVSQVVRKAAFDVEANAKVLAPVDTGALRASIQTTVTGELSAEVSVGAEYGPHVEYGTVHAGAQPFLTPAVDLVGPEFTQAVAAAVQAGAAA